MHVSAQPIDKFQDHVRFGFNDTFHHHLPSSIPDCDRDAFLMYVHADIFTASHKGCTPFWMVCGKHQKPYSKKGAPFYIAYCRPVFGRLAGQGPRAGAWRGYTMNNGAI